MSERCHSDICLVPMTDDYPPFAAGSEQQCSFCVEFLITGEEFVEHVSDCFTGNWDRGAATRRTAVKVGLVKNSSSGAIDPEQLSKRLSSNKKYIENEDQRACLKSLAPNCTIWETCRSDYCSEVQES